MRLVQEGRVQLDEVRQLLSHTVGGEFAYSGEGYMALQRLIEQRTGRRFADYMREAVLQPLGMRHSGFECRVEDLAPNFDRNLNVVPYRPFTELASAGLCASPRDLARFAIAFVGENPVLRRETLQAMLTPQPDTGGSWGLGITLFAPNIVGHDGGTSPAWGAMVRVNPVTGNGMVIAASGARGAINQLSGDWTWWETGVMTRAARRQVVYDRARPALLAIVIGALAIVLLDRRRPAAASRRTRDACASAGEDAGGPL
jgi:CubicO group peptidase (beta-lactamase class C family)